MKERCGMGTVRLATWATAASLAFAATCPTAAYAGGFEEPGIGTQAMGRGGAFTAKADDGTALEYNIAGLARQRGTRITIEGKLTLNHDEFLRTGNYGKVPNASYASQNYPYMKQDFLSAAPFLAISTDFNYFERWTFAIGLNSPSASAANRDWGTTVNRGGMSLPSPGRYDSTNVDLLVAYPMLAAAVRATKWLDIGLALQMVYGHFDLKADAYADLGNGVCGVQQNPSCDSLLHIKTSAFSATGALGVMLHPLDNLHIGVNVRGPMYLNSSGTTTTSPVAAEQNFQLSPGSPQDPAKTKLNFHLPWVLRFGIRYAFLDKKHREQADIEADGTYETWHQAEGTGDQLSFKALGPYTNVNTVIEHHYKDTGSFRVGGAYNFWFNNDSMLALRLGFFYDSAATSNAWTRIDFDTLAKTGYTLGLGYNIRGITINVAYNYIASNSRTVTNGHQQIQNGLGATGLNGQQLNPGSHVGPDGYEPVFNNGVYSSHTQVVMLGLTFNIEQIMKKQRQLTY